MCQDLAYFLVYMGIWKAVSLCLFERFVRMSVISLTGQYLLYSFQYETYTTSVLYVSDRWAAIA